MSIAESTIQDYIAILGEPKISRSSYSISEATFYKWFLDVDDSTYALNVWTTMNGQVVKVLIHPDFLEKLFEKLQDPLQRQKLLFNLDLFQKFELRR